MDIRQTEAAVKAAEERFVSDLLRENSELQAKLTELRALISVREAEAAVDIEVRRGREVLFK